MTRREADEYNNFLKKELEQTSLEYGMGEAVGDYLVDHFITVIPEDARKGMVFSGEKSASYKAGNVKIDFKKALIAGLELALSISEPENIFNYIQLMIASAFFIVKSVKREISQMESWIVYCLHEKNAYGTGVEEDSIVNEVQEWYQQKEGKNLECDRICEALNSLYEGRIVEFNSGKVYLREKVFGKVS